MIRALPVLAGAKILLWLTSHHRNPVWIYLQKVGWFTTYATMDQFTEMWMYARWNYKFIDFHRDGRLVGCMNPNAVVMAEWWPKKVRRGRK